MRRTRNSNSSSRSARPNPVCMQANSAGLAATWRASSSSPPPSFFFCPRGAFLSRPPPFCPNPQSCAAALFTVKPATLPRDFPVSFGWLQGATGRQTEPLLNPGKASCCRETAVATGQKMLANAVPANLQHPSGDLSSNNALKVLSHLHAMLQTSRSSSHPVVRHGDPAFHLLTRRTRSPDFLP